MLKTCNRLCAILAITALTVSAATADIDVYLNPVDSTIAAPGLTTNVEILADIPEADGILGWGLDLTVDIPAIASVTNVTIGPLWGPGAGGDGDNLSGTSFPPDHGVWGTGVLLATVELTGGSVGVSGLTLSDDYPADLAEGFALYPTGFATVNYIPGTVEVLPEPASIALLVLGALALRRR